MKAVLNVQGSKLKVTAIYYRENGLPSTVFAMDEDGREQQFIEKSQSKYVTHPHVAVDSLADLLEYPALEAKIVEDINQLLEDSRDHLKDLGEQIIQEVLVHHGLPFGDSSLHSLVKEYKEHSDYIDGVASALEVVKRDNYA